jgi:hypothetical protein
MRSGRKAPCGCSSAAPGAEVGFEVVGQNPAFFEENGLLSGAWTGKPSPGGNSGLLGVI